jgi:hypothetical protein
MITEQAMTNSGGLFQATTKESYSFGPTLCRIQGLGTAVKPLDGDFSPSPITIEVLPLSLSFNPLIKFSLGLLLSAFPFVIRLCKREAVS